MSSKGITLTRHILTEQQVHPSTTGELSQLLAQLGVAARTRHAGLGELLGQHRCEWGHRFDIWVLQTRRRALHQRVPLMIVTSGDVALAEEFMQGRRRMG